MKWACSALSFALMAGSADAQLGPIWGDNAESSRIRNEPPKLGLVKSLAQRQARIAHAGFGACVVKRRPTHAATFVLNPDLDPARRRRLVGRLADGDCLLKAVNSAGDLAMTLPGDTMRYALADALVRTQFANDVSSRFASSAPLHHGTFDEAAYAPEPGQRLKPNELRDLAAAKAAQKGALYMSAFGECVVRTAPAAAHALLMTEVESDPEPARFKALSPAFGGCMRAGQSLSIDKGVLRGSIAMNYYRLAKAVAGPIGQGVR